MFYLDEELLPDPDMNSTFTDVDNNTLLNQSDISVSESQSAIDDVGVCPGGARAHVPVRGGGRGGAQARGGARSTWEKIIDDNEQQLDDFPFLDYEGLNVRLPNNQNHLVFVDLYLADVVINLIVEETNRFADQFIQGDIDPDNTCLAQWEPVTFLEIKKFIGVMLLMGIIYKPSLHMYWSTDIDYSTQVFSQIMKRDRFFLILKFLHFHDNDAFDVENIDRLHKVRPLINLLRERFRKVYNPGKELSVDESLVLYKGRLKFKQFIRTKRARFGIKLYELCPSSEITLDFLVYCGKGMYDDDDLHSDMPSSERVPMVLMEPFIFTDNYYTSPNFE